MYHLPIREVFRPYRCKSSFKDTSPEYLDRKTCKRELKVHPSTTIKYVNSRCLRNQRWLILSLRFDHRAG